MSPTPNVTADALAELGAAIGDVLAQSQENNRALKSLCDFADAKSWSNFCSAGAELGAPSMTVMVSFLAFSILLLIGLGRRG
ncbi:MAG: hypothetical protein Q9168_004584 [Polycauliona sp. 1 TL-2023]